MEERDRGVVCRLWKRERERERERDRHNRNNDSILTHSLLISSHHKLIVK